MQRLYLVLSVLGVALPYAVFVPWLLEHGVNPLRFFVDAIANPIGLFAWLDVLVAVVALLAFIVIDGRRNRVKGRGFAIIGTLLVGVSCGLPLYLYLKEKQPLAARL